MPNVLVIVAARGATAWLPQCIGSVMAQHLPPGWKLGLALGIDACAPTLAMASQFDIPGLCIRFFPDHVGPYVVFNSLACASKADVLARFDADDVMLQGYLAAQLQSLAPDLRPTIVQTWSIYVDPHLRPCSALLADGTCSPANGQRPRPSDGQFLMTRSVFERLGGFRAWPCHADSDFLTRARWSGIPMGVIPRHLYLRRVHPDSLTASKQTGYRSRLRRAYAKHVKDACERYARGYAPDWVSPVTANYVPVGRLDPSPTWGSPEC